MRAAGADCAEAYAGCGARRGICGDGYDESGVSERAGYDGAAADVSAGAAAVLRDSDECAAVCLQPDSDPAARWQQDYPVFSAIQRGAGLQPDWRVGDPD